MHRRTFTLLGCALLSACIRVPGPLVPASADPLDASVSEELSADGALLRPPTGAAYDGPEVDASLNPTELQAGGGGSTAPGGFEADAGVAGASGLPGAIAAGADGGSGAAPAPPPPSTAGQVVITEIMLNPEALRDDEGEWLELYNPSTNATFDLRGCALDDGAAKPHPIASSLLLAPKAFVTVARSAKVAFHADALLSFSFANTADRVGLVCDGVEIDRVAYDGAFPLVAGASLSLDPGAMDASDNDRAEAWCAARTSYGADLGTPGAANPPCIVADDGVDAGAP